MKSFRDKLKDWTDIDVAQHELSLCLGIISEDTNFLNAKHMYWSDHPIGNLLYDLLVFLEENDVVEMRDHNDFGLQCRFSDKEF